MWIMNFYYYYLLGEKELIFWFDSKLQLSNNNYSFLAMRSVAWKLGYSFIHFACYLTHLHDFTDEWPWHIYIYIQGKKMQKTALSPCILIIHHFRQLLACFALISGTYVSVWLYIIIGLFNESGCILLKLYFEM